jgi:hypothetical protein
MGAVADSGDAFPDALLHLETRTFPDALLPDALLRLSLKGAVADLGVGAGGC